ncbi:MAG: enoyl-CoA hydratase/isomerase family protein [Planctomycetes bacterium]|nr:enoyl-CoA hydratase/isomerase family protein [Planctomycetota bacterium]
MDLVTRETRGGATVVRLADGKANTLGRAMVEALAAAAHDLAREPRGGGVVLTGAGRAFSAGLDLGEVLGFDRSALRSFLDLFEDMTLAWYGLPRPVVAALNGHAIAGGAVLALTADFRLAAAGELKFGFTEVPLGISLPQVVYELVKGQINPGAVNRWLLQGETVGPAEAVAAGFADRVVAPEALEAEACAWAARLAAPPGPAYAVTKATLRAEARRRMEAGRAAGCDAFIEALGAADVRAHIAATLEALRAKKRG